MSAPAPLPAELAARKHLIASSKGRFCGVTFIKADGTLRRMNVQPAKLALHVKCDAASEAGKKATATRKARHPHLFPVWDVQAKAPRSINLETVKEIRTKGTTYVYQ